jgi:transposase
MGKNLASAARRTGIGRRDRLVESGHRQLLGASAFWGAQTGPNPTDRGKNGSKRHVVCDGQGTPLAITHTGANVHDSQVAIPLVDAIPPIKRPAGGRRKRPDAAFADRAYDAEEKIRVPLRERGIRPFIAKRNTEHGSGLGVHRCVVEWVFSWLFKFRRLRVRYEKRADIHTAFLIIGCLVICWNRLEGFC